MATRRPIPDKLQALVKTLTDKTESASIGWQETDDVRKFQYSTARASVIIDGRTDSDGDFVGGLTIYNSNGSEVEKLRTSFETQREDGSYTRGPDNDDLQRLFTLARRSALDIDAILDELMGDLDSDDRT